MTNSPNLQWFATNAPTASSRTDDIWFVDPMIGWAVNSDGKILKTTDGGISWQQQFQTPIVRNRPIYLRSVGFANPLNGWVGTVSPEQRLYHTTDGGDTWTIAANLPANAPVKICGLSVVNESVIYASGTNDPADIPARMMKTVDGGATWTTWDMSEHATILIDNYFVNPDCGWVVGGKADRSIPKPSRDNVIPVVLYTEDGGETWVNRVADLSSSLPLGEWGWKIQFLNEMVGFVSLENFNQGAILKTTDGGNTWNRLRINDPQENVNLEGVGFIDEHQGWVGGWGSADFQGGFSSETKDGGQNWQDANQIGQFINRFRFFGNPVTVGYASGKTVYKYATAPVTAPLVERVAPLSFLSTNAPAKFDQLVNIEYTLPEHTQTVRIDIWNQFGSYVRQLVDQSNPSAGQKSVVWDGKDDAGTSLPPGIFIYRLTVDGNAESRVIRFDP
ncbi:YCF48-related protein [Chamaesiphon sp. OTE_75_metabat_556]|uniref:YCF48-related protein n=1 Tax=Chamaesiphon sp. OTE_75_metabat_556 TaxID=2964692 RepID=UPI00286C342E|nr:YCF48-related protein [Chamaesiphon sp. OTE_75_metabat_556]